MKTKLTLSTLFLSLIMWQTNFAQINIKVKVLNIAVLNTTDCDAGAVDNSDFVFEYKAVDNSPSANSNNNPVIGSIGMCNYAFVNNENGPWSYSTQTPGIAVFSPTTGLFFDRDYSCKNQIPTSLTLTWRAYENDDSFTPSPTSVANGTIAPQVTSYTVPTTSGTYTAQYTQTSTDGSCPQTYLINFVIEKSVGSFSPLQILFASSTTICNGATNGGLEANTQGGSGTVLIDWSTDGLSDYDDNLNLNNISAGTYTLVIKDALNCTDTAIATINTIAPPITFTSFTSSTPTVCSGQNNVPYEVQSQTGVIYNWNYTGAGTVMSGSGNAMTINYSNIATSGVLSVYAQNSCSVSPTLTLNITVNATPTISISGNLTVCNNASQILTATGATSYTWSTGAQTSTIIVSPTVATIYTINATSNNCIGTKQFTVNVLLSPTVQISASTVAVCPNQAVVLNAIGNGSLFIWSDGVLGASHTIYAPSTVVYMVTNTATNTCYSQASFTVNILPGLQIAVTGNTIVCEKTKVNLTATGANSYMWYDGTATNTYSFMPSQTTTVSVVGTALNGCKDSLVKTITVLVTPTVGILGNDSICEGQSVALTATSNGTVTYGWNNGANTQTINVSPVSTFTYNVTVFNGGCSASASHQVAVKLIPTINFSSPSVICSASSPIIFTANPSGGVYSGIGVSNNQFSPSVGPGIYYITYDVSVNNGCLASTTQSIEVTVCTDIQNLATQVSEFKLFPNPAITDLNLVSNKLISSIYIYDFTGKLTKIIETQSLEETISIQELPNGLYTLTVNFKDASVKTMKFIKQ